MVVGENFAKRSFGFVCFLLLFFANPSNQQQQKTREISEAMLLSSSNGECRCPCIGDEKNGNLQRLPKKLQSVVQVKTNELINSTKLKLCF
jgi:hypothetical protein